MTNHAGPRRSYASPVIARGAVLAASVLASTWLIRVQGLELFGLLATLLMLGRVGGALMPGEAQLALAQRSISAATTLSVRPFDVGRMVAASTLTAAGAAVAVDHFGATGADAAVLVVLAVVLAVVTALLRLVAIAVAQVGRTSLSAVCDISVVAPAAALSFLVDDLATAGVIQIVVLGALSLVCVHRLAASRDAGTPWPSTATGDLVAWSVAVLPMLHGQIGPVLGLFGLDADDVGLLAFAQRLSSLAPLILAGAGASVLAAPLDRARRVTLQYAKWGGLVFAAASLLLIAAWPLIERVVDVEGVGVTVLTLVLTANLINVASGPVGQYAVVIGQQRLDLASLALGVIALVPFIVFADSATEAAIGAVTVAAVRSISVWLLVARAEHGRSGPAPMRHPAVGGMHR